MEGEDKMAKSRKDKNKKIYEDLEVELKNNKENTYEEKLKTIDPQLNSQGEVNARENNANIVKRNEPKNSSALTVIAKKVNGEKHNNKKNELVVVKKEKKKNVKEVEEEFNEEDFDEPVSYTDKLSIEAILRAKLEQQQKLKDEKKNLKRSPNDGKYTPEMMQERIKQHEGVDVRKEVKLKHKDYKWVALAILVIALIAVIAIGALLIFKVI